MNTKTSEGNSSSSQTQSAYGPIGVADVNGDGLEDFYVVARYSSGELYLQTVKTFEKHRQPWDAKIRL
jgi:hypothetical protein